MRVVVLQSNYLPWRGYFDLIHDADRFVFYDEVQYTKNDWRNRNRLYSANGLHWLTVPVPKDARHRRISEVVPTAEPWRAKHLRSLHTTYGRAPHFGDLADFLRATYVERAWSSLSALNRHCITFFARAFGCTTELLDSKDYLRGDEGDRVDRLVSLNRRLGATEYLSGPAARGYLEPEEERFRAHGIAVRYKRYGDYPAYPQRRQPYEPAVSIVDLVAHVGLRSAPWYIWGHRTDPEPPPTNLC